MTDAPAALNTAVALWRLQLTLLATMKAKSIASSHWFSFVAFIPFVALLTMHHLLRLSDALMVQTPPGEREARFYNLVMVLMFFLGVIAFLAHSFGIAKQSRLWLIAKLSALLGGWSAFTLLA